MSTERPHWAKNLTDEQASRVVDALAAAVDLRVTQATDGTHSLLVFVVPAEQMRKLVRASVRPAKKAHTAMGRQAET